MSIRKWGGWRFLVTEIREGDIWEKGFTPTKISIFTKGNDDLKPLIDELVDNGIIGDLKDGKILVDPDIAECPRIRSDGYYVQIHPGIAARLWKLIGGYGKKQEDWYLAADFAEEKSHPNLALFLRRLADVGVWEK